MSFATRCLILAASCLTVPGVASAAWHKASTRHFIIYADENPDKLREFAARLEKFDQAVRHARSMQDHPPGDGNRLTVFVASSLSQIEKLHRGNDRYIAGFYVGRAEGSLAFVPRKAGDGSRTSIDPETIFFHEYAHHLMMQELNQPYPEWLVEGFAEFMSTATFEKDGSVGLGAPALHRAYSLFSNVQIPIEQLLAGNYGKLSPDYRASLYARGWLLAHYLTFEPQRRGQLETYLSAIARGDDPLQAARAAFGDVKWLDRNLWGYLKRRKLSYLAIAPSRINVGRIDVQPLSEGAAAIIPLRMQSKRGVNSKTSGPLAEKVRAAAARYPNDPLVQVTLAEAEYDAGNYDAANAAADRALKADPKSIEAMIYKGRVAMEMGEKSGSDVDWKEARRWFMAANKLDTEDPEPLMLFYRSYVRQGERPTGNAVAALHYASRLAPQDGGLRMTSAMQFLRDGKLDQARLEIAPIAFNPHGGDFSAAARKMLELVSNGNAKAALGIRPPEGEEAEE